jgi:hypothetical protein
LRSAKGKVVSSKMTCQEMMTIGGEIKAAVSFVMSGIAEEDAQNRSRSEFMRSGGGHIWVTLVAKDSQMIIRRRHAQQGKVWHGEL